MSQREHDMFLAFFDLLLENVTGYFKMKLYAHKKFEQGSISSMLLWIALMFLAGCETLQAVGSGEVGGKGNAANYSYGVPDRYRAGYP